MMDVKFSNNQFVFMQEKEERVGFKNIRAFNLVLLGKWLWRKKFNKTSLWYKILVHVSEDEILKLRGNKRSKR